MLRVALLAATLAAVTPSSASAYLDLRRCYEPSEPTCVSDDFAFRSDWGFQSCRSQVERFRSEVEEYLDCQRRNQRSAIEALNATIERFNCRARGGTFCP
jgi:hypothetical protein